MVAMPGEALGWNAVVVGAWNTAILSPDGVRRRLFSLPEGTPIELEVSVDRPGPFRIGHDGIVVVPTPGRLEVAPRVASIDGLKRACGLCQTAVQVLPETPVSAAGVNIRYQFTELPDGVFDLLRAPLDGALADAEFTVRDSTTKRCIALGPGVVNLSISHAQTGSGAIELNFHRDSSTVTELSEWLGRIDEFVAFYDRVAAVLGVN